jgi:hypothetical protein
LANRATTDKSGDLNFQLLVLFGIKKKQTLVLIHYQNAKFVLLVKKEKYQLQEVQGISSNFCPKKERDILKNQMKLDYE